MTEHVFLPDLDLCTIELCQAHREWLEHWLKEIERDIEDGDVASSLCLQSVMVEMILYNELRYDWRAIFEHYLTDEAGNPLAYSERYSKRLYEFDNQWRQTPVHAVHTRFWVDRVCNSSTPVKSHYVQLIEGWIQPNGWIYNHDVSCTRLRSRMKSEYLMSFAMGLEIMAAANTLALREQRFTATASSERPTPYLSAEYFRLRALELLRKPHLAPKALKAIIKTCEAGEGYCDFAVSSKVDDYMGSAKRTERDKAVHSPLAALHAGYLARHCNAATQQAVRERIARLRQHLLEEPLDIPAFRIRDIVFPFGTDVSPLEVIAAAAITQGLLEGKLQ